MRAAVLGGPGEAVEILDVELEDIPRLVDPYMEGELDLDALINDDPRTDDVDQR